MERDSEDGERAKVWAGAEDEGFSSTMSGTRGSYRAAGFSSPAVTQCLSGGGAHVRAPRGTNASIYEVYIDAYVCEFLFYS